MIERIKIHYSIFKNIVLLTLQGAIEKLLFFHGGYPWFGY